MHGGRDGGDDICVHAGSKYANLCLQSMATEYGGLSSAGKFAAVDENGSDTLQRAGINVITAKCVHSWKINEFGAAVRA